MNKQSLQELELRLGSSDPAVRLSIVDEGILLGELGLKLSLVALTQEIDERVKKGMVRAILDLACDSETSLTCLDILSTHENRDIRWTVARNPNVSKIILKRLAEDKDDYIRYAIARNSNTPISVLEKLARDRNTNVRCVVVIHPKTTLSIQEELARDESYDVRRLVASNPDIPNDISKQGSLSLLTGQLGSDNLAVKLSAVRESLKYGHTGLKLIEELLNQEISEEFREAIYRTLVDVASNRQTLASVLELLSEFKEKEIRQAIVGNESTNPQVLERFLVDPSSQIRCLLARNPKTPASVLIKLTDNEDERDIHYAIAKNPNAPYEALEKLSESEDLQIQQAVFVNFKTPLGVRDKIILKQKEKDLYHAWDISKVVNAIREILNHKNHESILMPYAICFLGIAGDCDQNIKKLLSELFQTTSFNFSDIKKDKNSYQFFNDCFPLDEEGLYAHSDVSKESIDYINLFAKRLATFPQNKVWLKLFVKEAPCVRVRCLALVILARAFKHESETLSYIKHIILDNYGLKYGFSNPAAVRTTAIIELGLGWAKHQDQAILDILSKIALDTNETIDSPRNGSYSTKYYSSGIKKYQEYGSYIPWKAAVRVIVQYYSTYPKIFELLVNVLRFDVSAPNDYVDCDSDIQLWALETLTLSHYWKGGSEIQNCLYSVAKGTHFIDRRDNHDTGYMENYNAKKARPIALKALLRYFPSDPEVLKLAKYNEYLLCE